MKIEASKRLQAATDTAGAAKYLKTVFNKYSLNCKNVTTDGPNEDQLVAEFKAPAGEVIVFIYLNPNKSVAFMFEESTGCFPDLEQDMPYVRDVQLKRGKRNSKELDKVINSVVKFDKNLDDYKKLVGKCLEWISNFKDALKEIESDMD